jgi:hypothetical protein
VNESGGSPTALLVSTLDRQRVVRGNVGNRRYLKT